MEGMDCLAWLEVKIKEASENANLPDFEHYTELLKQWTEKRRQLDG